jgi:hypothetical protein
MLQLAKHVHAKFQLSSFYPDGLGIFFVKKISEFFRRNLKRIFQKFKSENVVSSYNLQSMFMENFNSLFSTQTEIQIFSENS